MEGPSSPRAVVVVCIHLCLSAVHCAVMHCLQILQRTRCVLTWLKVRARKLLSHGPFWNFRSPYVHSVHPRKDLFSLALSAPRPQLVATMGKSQTKKKGWRHNPIRVPDSYLGHGKAAGQSGGGAKEGQLLPILNKVSEATEWWLASSVRRPDSQAPAESPWITVVLWLVQPASRLAIIMYSDRHVKWTTADICCSSNQPNTQTAPGLARQSATSSRTTRPRGGSFRGGTSSGS
jgi:hypothetical protein